MRAGEAATSPRWDALHEFIESELAAVATAGPVEAVRSDSTALDDFLAETVQGHEQERHGTD